MSKFLKVIVNLFLVCAILVAGAILVPPLLGVSTTVVDSASMDTNLPIGSVTYSQDVKVAEIAVGDKVLVESDTKAYAYIIEAADKTTGNFMVTDANDAQAEAEEIALRNVALKIVLTIPFIGYIMIAMRSMEGLIIIGLVVLFVIILFILSELWKTTDEDEEDEEDEIPENPVVRRAEPEKKKESYQNVTAEFTNDELARSITAIHNEKQEEAAAKTVVTEEPEVVQEKTTVEETKQEEAPVQEDGFVLVPRMSKEEILKKAKDAGEEPEVVEYPELGISLIDFSEEL